MTLTEIIKAAAAYAENVEIRVDSAFGTVAIGDDIFMQGDDAVQFIEEAIRLWHEAGDVTMAEVYAHLAGPYLDTLT